MKLTESTYTTKTGALLRERWAQPRPMVTMDPGKSGGVMSWQFDRGAIVPMAASTFVGRDINAVVGHVARHCRSASAGLLIVETQFGRAGPSAIVLAHHAALIVGGVAAYLDGYAASLAETEEWPLDVVWVTPSTWQVILTKGKKLPKKQLKNAALNLFRTNCKAMLAPDSFDVPRTKVEQGGIADAHGLGVWWRRRLGWRCEPQKDQPQRAGQ